MTSHFEETTALHEGPEHTKIHEEAPVKRTIVIFVSWRRDTPLAGLFGTVKLSN
jgi:hypothetical protein